jgi:dipeptidase E
LRLFLSSEGFGNYPNQLLDLVGGNKKTAFIDNAKDEIPEAERMQHVAEKRSEFENVGLIFEEIDLRNYFGKQAELLQKLEGFGLIWLSGGNTFVLRRALAYSGLDKILKDILSANMIAYGGSSAGSIIPTPSLHGTEFGDDPGIVPDGYKKEVVWDGLDLVPFHVVPHFGSDWFGQESIDMERYLKENSMPYKTIKDGQVIVIDGDKEEFLK